MDNGVSPTYGPQLPAFGNVVRKVILPALKREVTFVPSALRFFWRFAGSPATPNPRGCPSPTHLENKGLTAVNIYLTHKTIENMIAASDS
jgi:hypothetical protein